MFISHFRSSVIIVPKSFKDSVFKGKPCAKLVFVCEVKYHCFCFILVYQHSLFCCPWVNFIQIGLRLHPENWDFTLKIHKIYINNCIALIILELLPKSTDKLLKQIKFTTKQRSSVEKFTQALLAMPAKFGKSSLQLYWKYNFMFNLTQNKVLLYRILKENGQIFFFIFLDQQMVILLACLFMVTFL